MIQDAVWLISVILMAAIAVVFLWVAAGAGQKADAEAVQRRAYRVRAGWFWLLVVVMGCNRDHSAGLAIPRPWAAGCLARDRQCNRRAMGVDDRGTRSGRRQARRVPGYQCRCKSRVWDLQSGNGDGGTDQAMPGYVNRLQYTFTAPGTYRILCLEYCGLVHHQMMTDLVVKPD